MTEAKGALETGYTKHLLQFLEKCSGPSSLMGERAALGARLLSDGTLLDNEYCQDDIRNLGQVKAATANTRMQYYAKMRRIDNVLASPALPDLRE